MQKYFIILFCVIFFSIYGCKSTDDAKRVKYITSADDLLGKIRKAIDPKGTLENVETLECSATIVTFAQYLSSKKEKKEKFYYKREDPKLIYLHNEYFDFTNNSRNIKSNDVVIVNGKSKVYVDGIEQTSKILDSGRLDELKELARDYIKSLFLGLFFEEPLSMELSDEIVDIDGTECYQLTTTLLHRYIDGSNQLKYYVDCNDFLIKKVDTEYYNIVDIRYKNFKGVNYICKTKNLSKDFSGPRYVEIESLKINEKLNLDYLYELIEKKVNTQ